MNTLKSVISLFKKPFSIVTNAIYINSLQKTAFEKGCMYAIDVQEKDEFAEFGGLNQSIVDKDFDKFFKRLPSTSVVKIQELNSEEKIKESFTIGYKASWFCPIIVNQVEGMSKFEYIERRGKYSFMRLLWKELRTIDKKGVPLVLEAYA